MLKKKFPLPKFPPSVSVTFRSVCQELPLESLPELRTELNNFVNAVLSDPATKADLNSLRSLYDRALFLLDVYPDRTNKEQSLIIGAIRYFAAAKDSLPEIIFSTRFNDDIQVMNHVLEELGLESRSIELSS